MTHKHLPLVSIIVPFFGTSTSQAVLLDETLASVDAQTCSHYEVIVVDDGSSVDVSDVVAAHERTRLHRQANAGSAIARNAGILLSRGECMVFLDADDHLLPNALAVALEMLSAHPEAGFVVGPREEMTFEGEPVPWAVAPPPPQTDLYLPLLGFDWYIIPPSSAMFRRSVVEAVGGFRNPWGADDLDFYLRAAWHHKAWCYQSPAITRYRRYSTSSSRNGQRMLDSIRVVYDRQQTNVAGDPVSMAAFDRGLSALTDIFLDCVVENVHDRLRLGDRGGAVRSARLLVEKSPERWGKVLATGGSDIFWLESEIGGPPGYQAREG
jgi:glycosyltransferase involved in cell wall biosynthesis